MIDRLLSQHANVGRVADELRDLCQQASLPDLATLARIRWDFSRELLLHLSTKDRYIYSNLEQSPDAAVAKMALALREEQEALQNVFRDHVMTWTAEAIAADWHGYRTATLRVLPVLRDRMARDERDLYPLAAGIERTASLNPNNPKRNWAREAWRLRDSIGHEM